MAKKNKKKSNIPFPVLMALRATAKKNTNSKEEYDKVMMAFESLDMQTLLTDPEALARVMSNPAGELRNFVRDGVDVDAPSDDNIVGAEDAGEGDVSEVESEAEMNAESEAVSDDESGC